MERNLALIFTLLTLASAPCLAAEPKPTLRIPALVQRWKLPDDKELPEITIQQVGVCMALDLKIRTRIHELREGEERVNAESADFPPALQALEEQQKATNAEGERLAAASAALDVRSAALDQRGKALDADRTRAQQSKAGVQAFNQKVAALNAAYASLRTDAQAYNAAVDKHRASVDRFNDQVAEYNTRLDDFKRRNAIHLAAAEGFQADYEGYTARCSGDRTLK